MSTLKLITQHGAFKISRYDPPVTLNEIVDDMVLPLLRAAGYFPEREDLIPEREDLIPGEDVPQVRGTYLIRTGDLFSFTEFIPGEGWTTPLDPDRWWHLPEVK